MVVISPHLDDAVLGCGALLATHPGSTVLTVFAGTPRESRQTAWDARCGFADAREAMATRRREDDAALGLLRACAQRLDFLDHQYGDTPCTDRVAGAVHEVLVACSPQRVLLPMGLFHSDHLLAHEAARTATRALPGLTVLLYEDALYRGLHGVLQQRLIHLARDGAVLTPARLPRGDGHAAELKRQAVLAYRSQLRGFGPGGYDDAEQPERFWTLDTTGRADGPR